MTAKIAFFVGSDVPASTQNLFTNLFELISDNFDIDVVGFYRKEKFKDNVNEVIYDYPSDEGLMRVYHAYKVIKKYNKIYSPELIVSAHKHGVYGPSFLLSSVLSKTIFRLNIDAFNFYKDELYETKFNRFKAYLVNNVLSNITLGKASGIIVQTDYMYEQCRKRKIDPDKITVLPLPIEENRFKPVSEKKKLEIRQKLNVEKNKALALIVGSESRRKRHHRLDELLKSSDNLENIIFMIIGKTDYGKDLAEKYTNVRYEGFVEHDKLHKYYQAGDFLLHFASREGFPTVFQEASACDIPIIAKKANYNEGMDIYKYDDLEELEHVLRTEKWKDIETYVTPGLSKEEYIDFFKKMIERYKSSSP